jgi:radical SAM superfamily enzyme YgiQ (UPF0313 family)
MDRLRQSEESIPGIGMLVLAAVARRDGYDVAIFDAKGSGETPANVAERVLRFRADVVGFSATTISITNAARIAGLLKRSAPEIITVVGGPHVSAIPERTLRAFPDLEFGIIGEGEISFFELLARLPHANGRDRRQSPLSISQRSRFPPASGMGPRARISALLPAVDLQLPEVAGRHSGDEPRVSLLVLVLRSFHIG